MSDFTTNLNNLTTAVGGLSPSLQTAAGRAKTAAAAVAGTTPMEPDLQSWREISVAANSTANYQIDCNAANDFALTLTANCTLTVTNVPPSGQRYSVTLMLIQDGTGGRTVVWPSGTKWSSAGAPTLSTGAGKVDFVCLTTRDGGASWYGFVGQQGF